MNELSDEQQEEFDKHLEKLDEYLNDAFEHIEKAQSDLFLQSNVFSDCIGLEQFNEMLIERLKVMM